MSHVDAWRCFAEDLVAMKVVVAKMKCEFYPVGLVDDYLAGPLLVFEAVVFLVLMCLLILNIRSIIGEVDASTSRHLRFRLLICNRLGVTTGLLVLIQFVHFIVFSLFSLSGLLAPEGVSSILISQLVWSLNPIIGGVWVAFFGAIQFIVFDAILRVKRIRSCSESRQKRKRADTGNQ